MLAKVFAVIGLALTGLVGAVPAADPQKLDPVLTRVIDLTLIGPTRTLIPLPTTTTCPAVTVTRSVTISVTRTVSVTVCPNPTPKICPINCTSTIGYVLHVLCEVPPQGCTNTIAPTFTRHWPPNQLCPTIYTTSTMRSCNPTPGCPEPTPVTVDCPYAT